MPWQEMCAMEQRMRFVIDYQKEGPGSLAALSRAYGISRPTAYKWLERHAREGLGGLRERSRAPLWHPNALDPELRELLLAARRAHMSWGPRKLLAWLARKHPKVTHWPAASTVGELLKRHGLVHARRRRGRATPTARALAAGREPNEVWCADFKGWWRMGNGERCEPLTISDQATRYLIRCQALERPRQESVGPLFEAAFRELGLPRVMRTDNGAPFGSVGLLGLSRLAVWWMRLGIVPERIEPAHPEQNGRHERMHETLKGALRHQRRAYDLRTTQDQLAKFREEYNHERPHEALDNGTPGEFYQRSTREFPERLAPVEYAEGVQVRRVHRHGGIQWHNNTVFLSEVLAGEDVGLEWIDDRTLNIRFMDLVLATYDAPSGQVRFADGRQGRRTQKKGRHGRLTTRQKV